MSRWMAIDYGTKRTGIAVTDRERIIAAPLCTVATASLWEWITTYLKEEPVERIIFGQSFHADGTKTDNTLAAEAFAKKVREQFSSIIIDTEDELLTSVQAQQAILHSGMKKKQRQEKDRVDRVAAAIILQNYCEKHRGH